MNHINFSSLMLYIIFHHVLSSNSATATRTNQLYTDSLMHATAQSRESNRGRRLLFTLTGNEDIVSCPNLGSTTCICPNAGQTLGRGCILQCLGDDQCKSGQAQCRNGDECSVVCSGKSACSENSFHGLSGSTCLSVQCIGEDAWYFAIHILFLYFQPSNGTTLLRSQLVQQNNRYIGWIRQFQLDLLSKSKLHRSVCECSQCSVYGDPVSR